MSHVDAPPGTTSTTPTTLKTLSFKQTLRFTRLLSNLKNDIILVQPSRILTTEAPAVLPPSIKTFLAAALVISEELVVTTWKSLRHDIWDLPSEALSEEDEGLFRAHGWKVSITSLTIYPPSHHCTNPVCGRKSPMKRAEAHQVVVYTLSSGVIPAWSVQLYCPDCNTTYHPDYSVQKGRRTYYGGIPRYIQIGAHQFAEKRLIAMWISLMLVAWVSATNCSRSYDMALSGQEERDFAAGGWQFGCLLTTDHVWDTFTILTLLDYNERKGTCLQVPQTGDQRSRFKDAMAARNAEVILEGQEGVVDHCCDKCMRRDWTDADGVISDIQAILCDGIAMGHVRCQTPHCTTALDNNRHRFCAAHRGLNSICSIVGCERVVVPGTKSCEDRKHADMERLHYERGKASFTLRDRLQRHRINHPTTDQEEISEEDIEWFELDEQGRVHVQHRTNPGSVGVTEEPECEASKDETGNCRYKALFGRCRTHNEQLLVWPCGVIFARATFYHAEAVSNVLLFVQKAFSVPSAHKPEHFIYDTNCDAKQQVDAHPEIWSWWKDVGMTVNVFHFLNKHAVGHMFCQEHCNPASCPELSNPDKTWYFNTSIAEQTNVWFGGYHSMCREMLPDDG
ncbi:hypothetical protein DFH07DRAFT_1023762 [Mycena maculata]|uniref:CxC5 like cysteine cluster associated with KDZ domain-containing protein n=1 Tax=Mycena maculata TaxID=230809 RepID=A0AAD7J8I4_9AGAR|nr:hypothetical protein DFH07DRAFT_1023762 [Mycena maculata]